MPPYAVAAVILLSLSYASDKLQSRGIFMSIACALGGIGYLYVYFLEFISLFGGSNTFVMSDFYSRSRITTMFGTLQHSAS